MKKWSVIVILSVIVYQKINAQVTFPSNTFNLSTDYVGWDATFGSPPLLIKTTNPDPINFVTNNNATPNMQIDANGLVGIGTAAIPPSIYQLEVSSEINIVAPANYYMIGGNTILQNNGSGNIFTGVNSGNLSPSLTGAGNSCYGDQSGFSLVGGDSNTFIGSGAGYSNVSGYENVFVGVNAGWTNTSNMNTFIGYTTGFLNTLGYNNTFVGYQAGYFNTSSGGNTYLGSNAGLTNNGYENVMVGSASGEASAGATKETFLGVGTGRRTTGADNVFLGYLSGYVNVAGARNTFIGSGTGINNGEGSENLFAGFEAGKNNIGSIGSNNGHYNVFLGSKAGFSNQAGNINTFAGYKSGYNNTVNENTFYGSNSGESNTTGEHNTFIGTFSGFNNISTNENTFVGYYSGYNNKATRNTFNGSASGRANTSGDDNSFYGYNSGTANTTGKQNLFSGSQSGNNNTTGLNNVFNGFQSGYSNVSGNQNTFSGALSGYFNTESDNTFLGFSSGTSNTTGTKNNFNGSQSGKSNTTGRNNTFGGYESGFSNVSGNQNTFSGSLSGYANTASNNTFLGFSSGTANTSGDNNTFSGSGSGIVNTTGADNTFIGFNSGAANTTAGSNTFIGSITGSGNTTGEKNTFVGQRAGVSNTTGSNSVFVGYRAGTISTGKENTFIGDDAGATCSTGESNTVLGKSADCTAAARNQTVIGHGATSTTDNTLILGNNVNVGIGLSGAPTGPQKPLEINTTTAVATGASGLRFRDLTTASATVSNPWPVGSHAVLTVNSSGDVVLVPSDGGGNVTACTTGGGPGVGTANYITKFVGATDICNSTIWEDAASPFNVGIGTFTPQYKLQNLGTALFTDAGGILLVPLSQNYTRDYPLAVRTIYNGTYTNYAGLAIFAGTGAASARDELNLFVDDDGTTSFESYSHYTNFYYKPISPLPHVSGLGIDPVNASTIIKDDFPNAIPDSRLVNNARLYVESQDHQANHIPYAVFVNNASNATVGAAVSTGIRAQTVVERAVANSDNTGGEFIAQNAVRNNIGVVGSASKQCISCSMNFAGGGSFTAQDAYINHGLDAVVTDGNGTYNAGGLFQADNGWRNYAVYGTSVGNQDRNCGGYFRGSGTTVNYGVYAEALNGTANYAVYAVTPNGNCSTSTLSSGCTDAAGFFNGDVFVINGSYYTSDSTLKTNIAPLQNSSAILNQLNSYTYNFDTSKTHGMSVSTDMQYGFLAQEVKQILPGLVKNMLLPEDSDSSGNIISPSINFMGVNTPGLIPILIGGFNEQQALIDTLTAHLDILEAIVNNCCGPAPRPGGNSINENNRQTIELKDIKSIILDQNVPNPFAEETDIRYVVPSTVKNATIFIYDQAGNVLKKVDINERGEGTLHIYAQDLSSGLYTYSLVADGKVIETKTMVKTK